MPLTTIMLCYYLQNEQRKHLPLFMWFQEGAHLRGPKHAYYIVINMFLLISMEYNRAIYHCICTLGIVIFGKVLMRFEIGLQFIAPICRFVNKKGGIWYRQLQQNTEFEEMIPEERNTDVINVDKHEVNDLYAYMKLFSIRLKYNKIHNICIKNVLGISYVLLYNKRVIAWIFID